MATRDEILNLAIEMAMRHRSIEAAESAMRFLGIPTFGIETVSCAGRSVQYVNTGDTYDDTIYHESGDGYSIGSWGDWYEETENAHCAENDEVRCGYCGELTPLCDKAQAQPEGARHAWRETVCQHCGHNVSTGELASARR